MPQLGNIDGFVQRRPRILNFAHALRLYSAGTTTEEDELACIAKYAFNKQTAVEIGTHMGVSAAIIAAALAPDGKLYCVDPWPRRRYMENPSLSICLRELSRKGVRDRVTIVRKPSSDASGMLPQSVDFMFIDGDHSREGLTTDWNLCRSILAKGGVACFHDTSVDASQPWWRPESVDYFREAIMPDPEFMWLATCRTLNVLSRRS